MEDCSMPAVVGWLHNYSAPSVTPRAGPAPPDLPGWAGRHSLVVVEGGGTDMKTFVLGLAAGYVLGSRAGRERYEQLVQAYRRLADHPMVQGVAGIIRAKVGERLGR
jgi:hypothetical protein